MRLLEHAGMHDRGPRMPWSSAARNIVGKPLALLLLQKDATVTICHSKTRDLARHLRAAPTSSSPRWAGRNSSARRWSNPAPCVIDVGMNRLPDGKLAGDVDFDAVQGSRRLDHAGPRRRRPDDDRDAARKLPCEPPSRSEP